MTFLVMPVFALANGGVALGEGTSAALQSSLAWGIILGLFLGKPIGILGFSWLSVRLGIAELPEDVGWAPVGAVAVLGGIGFTVSLFIGSLAFDEASLGQIAKVGILLGSLVSAVVGGAALYRVTRRMPPNQEA